MPDRGRENGAGSVPLTLSKGSGGSRGRCQKMQLAMIQAFIFDLDGVIVDTARYHYWAWRRLANELGFDFEEEKNEELKGVGRMESLELILEWGGVAGLSEARKHELAELKNGWYQEYVDQMERDEILPGVMEFLDAARAQGIRLAIGSGSKNAPGIIDRLALNDYFAALIDGGQLTRSKPDPQVFELAAEALGLAPGVCAVFEDAAKGVDAALAGGFYAVGVGLASALGHAHVVISGFERLTPSELAARLLAAKAKSVFGNS